MRITHADLEPMKIAPGAVETPGYVFPASSQDVPVAVPDYLRDVYTWAYLNPRNVRLLDRNIVIGFDQAPTQTRPAPTRRSEDQRNDLHRLPLQLGAQGGRVLGSLPERDREPLKAYDKRSKNLNDERNVKCGSRTPTWNP